MFNKHQEINMSDKIQWAWILDIGLIQQDLTVNTIKQIATIEFSSFIVFTHPKCIVTTEN